MSYYHTCEKCGSNLDPGEKCDCDKPKILPKEDCLIVSFDNAMNGSDHACLCVLRNSEAYVEVINCYYDNEAREMYSKLVTQAPQGKIKII